MISIKLEITEKPITSVSAGKFYGVFSHEGCKGLITISNCRQGYRVIDANKIDCQHSFNTFIHPTTDLQALVKDCLNNFGYDVFEFETAKELFKWLGE